MQVNVVKKAFTLIPPEDHRFLQIKYQDDVPIKELQEVLELSERRKNAVVKSAK
jgi:RNA polymerase sigma-70 factor (ECF subfamily)